MRFLNLRLILINIGLVIIGRLWLSPLVFTFNLRPADWRRRRIEQVQRGGTAARGVERRVGAAGTLTCAPWKASLEARQINNTHLLLSQRATGSSGKEVASGACCLDFLLGPIKDVMTRVYLVD